MDFNMQMRRKCVCCTIVTDTTHKADTVTDCDCGALRRELTLHMHKEEEIPCILFLNGNSTKLDRI